MKSLRAQLILSHILPLLILLPLLGVLLLYIVETQVVLADFADELAREAVILAQVASAQQGLFADQAQAEVFVRAAGLQYDRNVALFQADGSQFAVVVDTNVIQAPLLTASELEGLNNGQVKTRSAFNADPSLVNLQAFAPVLDPQQRLIGIVRVSEHIDRVYTRLTQMRLLILGATFIALLVAVAVGTVLATRTARRLDAVTGAIMQVASGGSVAPPDRTMPSEFRGAFEAVNDLQKRLQDSEAVRKRLLANLVHELGRPLGALQAAVHALLGGADKDPALRLELLEGMDGQIERLKPLLDNLASLHGGLSGAIELHRSQVNLNDWLPKAVVTWREAAEQKGLAWTQEMSADLPTLNMDGNRMSQALGNLISNAIKYTPESGSVNLSAGRQENEVQISVQDTGLGISREEQSRIFDPLYRGNPTQGAALNRFPQGMGLGLAIARDVVAAHGGRIEVESEVGKGSRFTIVLPV